MDLREAAQRYRIDRNIDGATLSSVPPNLAGLASVLGGCTFGDGVLRVYDAHDAARWTAVVDGCFPSVAGRTTCFASDWLGRQFGLTQAGDMVLLHEPGTAEVLEIPTGLSGFFEEIVVDDLAEAALLVAFYADWRDVSSDVRPLDVGECVGYEVPLFLGGVDGPENLCRTDMDVYLELSAQLARGIGL